MLFGRKKPGFVEYEPADESECEEKPELMEYLHSLPDVEDIYEDAAEEPDEEEETPLTEVQKLAGYIRIRSASSCITSEKSLIEEVENYEELIEELKTDETCGDIKSVKGNKDIYFYSSQNMSDNYAMIASLVEEKDLVETLASMTRFNCKTYPVPTPLVYFERSPYLATPAQLDRALSVMSQNESYSDIKVFENSKKLKYLYSEELMSERYAKALAEDEEFTD